jgi:hypothetical protein
MFVHTSNNLILLTIFLLLNALDITQTFPTFNNMSSSVVASVVAEESTSASTPVAVAKRPTFTSLSELRAYIDSKVSTSTPKPRVFVYFFGRKENNVSWCSDCNNAWPIIQKFLDDPELLNGQTDEFVLVDVGDRPTWKNPENEFRTDPDTKLIAVPTLIEWKKVTFLINLSCYFFKAK